MVVAGGLRVLPLTPRSGGREVIAKTHAAFAFAIVCLLALAAGARGASAGDGSETIPADLRDEVANALAGSLANDVIDAGQPFRYEDPLSYVEDFRGFDPALIVIAVVHKPLDHPHFGALALGGALGWLSYKREFRAREAILEFARPLPGNPRYRWELCLALGRLCGDEGFALLLRYAESDSAATRVDAVWGLREAGAKAIPALERLSHDAEALVSGQAKRQLNELRSGTDDPTHPGKSAAPPPAFPGDLDSPTAVRDRRAVPAAGARPAPPDAPSAASPQPRALQNILATLLGLLGAGVLVHLVRRRARRLRGHS